MSIEQKQLIEAAFLLLGRMGGNTSESPFRAAWDALRELLKAV